tara:strand:+ start:1252 stop:1941 length:690 start_codon:yes stop_codon:yes gene_type:complete
MENINRIFITGCAKSGTTLLLRLFYSFKNVEVIYRPGFDGHEISVFDLLSIDSNKEAIISKRHPPSILSDIHSTEIEKQYDLIKKNQITIINVVRDGRDVILSDGNWVKPERWISCIEQRKIFKDIINFEVKFEDLVTDPDSIQDSLEKAFDLKKEFLFSDYPNFVEDWVFDWNVSVQARKGDKKEKHNYGKRKISNSNVGKNKDAYKKLCTQNQIMIFEKCLKDLGYK